MEAWIRKVVIRSRREGESKKTSEEERSLGIVLSET